MSDLRREVRVWSWSRSPGDAVTGRQFPKRGTQLEILIRTDVMRRRFESRVNPELLHDALDVGIDDLPGESELGCDRAAVHPCFDTRSAAPRFNKQPTPDSPRRGFGRTRHPARMARRRETRHERR
jgi:hypothetical protein